MNIRVQSLLLSLSFFFSALARFQTPAPQSLLQVAGIIFLSIAALRHWQVPSRRMLTLVAIGSFILGAGWIVGGGEFPNVINTFFILMSFPLALAASKGLAHRRLFRNVMIIIFGLALFGAAMGEISVNYLGDARGQRLIMGFKRPTFLSEAMVLFIIASVGWAYNKSSSRSRAFLLFQVISALIVLLQTGSRAGLGAAIIFLYFSWETQLSKERRLLVTIATRMTIIFTGLVLVMVYFEPEAFNKLTTGRWLILVAEVKGNLTQAIQWYVGNTAAQTVFEYSSERVGSVYHFDSFFGERLVVNGILGLAVILFLIFNFSSHCSPRGRAIIAAAFFYGIFENGVFNITSSFSIFMLVFAASISRLERARDIRNVPPRAEENSILPHGFSLKARA